MIEFKLDPAGRIAEHLDEERPGHLVAYATIAGRLYWLSLAFPPAAGYEFRAKVWMQHALFLAENAEFRAEKAGPSR